MAMFPEVTTYYKGRTHTSLVISEGKAPAEKYIPSASEAIKFQYEFGPSGNQNVVIPKGKAVALSGVEWDYETEKYVPALKIANGKSDAGEGVYDGKSIIGINHHNVYERVRDRFSGNQPTVITREYIELPLFASASDANAIKFGAAWVDADSNIAAANAIIGKPIAVDENGNLTVATDTYDQVIGQCLGVETDVPPAGYLQYFMEMDDNQWTEFVRQQSYAPSPGRTKDAAWNDVGTYPAGTSYLNNKADLLKNFRSGIPFLTDGYFKARTTKTYKLDGFIDSEGTALDNDDTLTEKVFASWQLSYIKKSGDITINETTTTGSEDRTISLAASDKEGAALWIKLPDPLANDVLKTGSMSNYPEFAGSTTSGITVSVGGSEFSEFHVDYTNNMIVIYFNQITSDLTDAEVEITATVLENQIPGIPTGWDFKGSYGAARILLQK